MINTRPPAVAGQFYPADPDELLWDITSYLRDSPCRVAAPKAIIAPHAGYIYSGTAAARAYSCIKPSRETIKRVVLLGPAHRVYFRGMALPSTEAFATPLDSVAIDRWAYDTVADAEGVVVMDEAHRLEHSLEVQLPFLQVILKHFTLLPLVVGDVEPHLIRNVLEMLDNGEQTLFVVSSDLSHYHGYDEARRIDSETTKAIEELRWEDIHSEQACGCMPIRGLLDYAKNHKLQVTTLAQLNSGDSVGPHNRVVGYGAYALHKIAHADA